MKILMTAFDPFGGESVNPAQEAVKHVDVTGLGAEVIKIEIPTVFGKAIEVVAEAMRRERPDVVVAVGQAGGRFEITPERVAINVDDARIADNEGNQPIDQPIFADGPAAYFATIPIKAMVKAIQDIGIPAAVSNTAGTFVCNHLMYGILYLIDKELPQARGGFIHVPFIPEQAVSRREAPSMSMEDISRALRASLEAIIKYEDDIELVGGAEH
ncbi:MAG: pyroglutamyl-peptidase I [Saccharofermentanales bacterium]|jgi:pyroglutamyl-peptidase|nr:pyroglutamyl-peptidase I [Bacillota bacterium]NLB09265.1 pyroglutamyl-peptidase I [Clostridiales bacterium]